MSLQHSINCSRSYLPATRRNRGTQPKQRLAAGIAVRNSRTGQEQPQLAAPSTSTGGDISSVQASQHSGNSTLSVRQRQAAQFAAASGAIVALALAAPSTYSLLSSLDLPPISSLAEAVAGLAAAAAALAKAVYGDNVHLESHK